MRKKIVRIAPSIHTAKDDYLKYIKRLSRAGADLIHLDVMDGKFVKDSFLSPEEVYEISQNTLMPLDIHLMVESVEKSIDAYLKANPTIITIHRESFDSNADVIDAIKTIRKHSKNKCLIGLSVKPSTDIEELELFLNYIDLVLIMSVIPGKSGQNYMKKSTDRIKQVKQMIGDRSVLIEVDGGIDDKTSKLAIEAGADILVSASYIYGSDSLKKAIASLK